MKSVNDPDLAAASGAGSPGVLDPTAFVRIMMDKIQRKHKFQLEPFFRGTVTGYNATGGAFVRRTGEAVADEQPYYYLGVLPLVGQDVYLSRVNGGKPIIVGPVVDRVPNAYAWRSTAQSVPHDTTSARQFDVFRLDTHGHFTSENLTRFVVRVPGVYLLGASTEWDMNAGNSNTGRRLTSLVKNGTTPFTGGDMGKIIARTAWAATASDNTQNCWGMDYLGVDEWIHVTNYQSSGASLNVNAGGLSTSNIPYTSSFWAVYVAPPPYWL